MGAACGRTPVAGSRPYDRPGPPGCRCRPGGSVRRPVRRRARPAIASSRRSPGGVGDRIGLRDVGVAEDLEAMTVMGGEDRLQEGNDGVLPEIGRDVADPQASPGRGPGRSRLDRSGRDSACHGRNAGLRRGSPERRHPAGSAWPGAGCCGRAHHPAAWPGPGGSRRWPRPCPWSLQALARLVSAPKCSGSSARLARRKPGPDRAPPRRARQAEVVPGVHQVRPELDRPLEVQPRLRHPVLVQNSTRPRLLCASARSGWRYSACSKLAAPPPVGPGPSRPAPCSSTPRRSPARAAGPARNGRPPLRTRRDASGSRPVRRADRVPRDANEARS